MPYLAVDLDGKKRFPLVARAIGCSVGDVAWGLLELWELTWQRRSDIVTAVALAGCFGHPNSISALVEFGFIESTNDGFRVLGAEKYLRVTMARKEAADRTNLLKKSRSTVRSTERSTVRSDDGLTPNTQHPTPNKPKESLATPVELLVSVWNHEKPEHCPAVEKITDKRESKAATRLRETPDIEVWRTAIQRLHKSDFCSGRKADSSWAADFEFLLKPDTLTKILEGSYDNRGPTRVSKGPVDAGTQNHTYTGVLHDF